MRYLPSAALWLAVTGASLSGQIPAGESGRLQPLPLTQLDERALAAELDNRSFTLNRIEGAFIRVGPGQGRVATLVAPRVELVIMLTPRSVRPVGAR